MLPVTPDVFHWIQLRPVGRWDLWLDQALIPFRCSEIFSAYAQLTTDARNDVEMIEPFYAIAGRVLDMDRKRAISLSHVSHLNEAEYGNAINRNNENAAIVGWVCRSIGERASAYRYTLERLVIAAPSPSAAEADRTLNLLAMRIGAHCKPHAGAHVVAKD